MILSDCTISYKLVIISRSLLKFKYTYIILILISRRLISNRLLIKLYDFVQSRLYDFV